MKKIFITGATGNIGSGIVKELVRQEADVTCGIANATDIQGAKTALINYDDVDGMVEAMKGHDVVFILAPLGEKMKAWSLNIIEAAKKASVSHIVRSSGFGSDSSSEYMLLKEHGLIDDAVKASGINYTITRPNTFMQNFVYFYGGSIKEQGAIYLPNGESRITYSDVRDVSLANANVLLHVDQHVNQTYDLLGEPMNTHDIAKVFTDALGKAVNYVPVSVKNASDAMLEAGMDPWIVEALDSLNAYGKDGKTDVVTNDIRVLTGHKAKSIKDFVNDHLDAWK